QGLPAPIPAASGRRARGHPFSQADQLSLRRERSTFTSNLFSLSAAYQSPLLNVSPYYQLSTFFDSNGSDTIANTAGISLGKTFYEINTAALGYEFTTSDSSSGGSDITGHRVFGSLTRHVNPETSLGL